MQISNDFVIIARDVSIDFKDKMMSISKIIDKFNYSLDPENYKKFLEETKSQPAGLPATYVVSSSWSLDKPAQKEFNAILESRIIDPSGKELDKSRNEIKFAVGGDRIRLNGEAQGLPVTSNGRYKLELAVIDKDTNEVLCNANTSFQVEVKGEK